MMTVGWWQVMLFGTYAAVVVADDIHCDMAAGQHLSWLLVQVVVGSLGRASGWGS